MMQASPRTKVLSIVGPGRSGTTVLASVLAEADGIVSAGELRWLWRRGIVEGRPCGCGRPPAECQVWSRILAELLGKGPYVFSHGVVAPAVAEIVSAELELAGRRDRLRILRSASTGSTDWPALVRLRAVTAELCTALADVSGACIVVDTSKRAQDAALLASASSVDHYVLHVVRDPRAVAWSWGRAKPLVPSRGDTTMATRSALSSAVRWIENCIGAEVLRRHIPAERWHFLRYEDFVVDPRRAVRDVLAFVGSSTGVRFDSGDTVALSMNHTVAGNPNRFRTGSVKIVADDEWRSRMPRRDRMLVEALALPLLRRYGYSLH